MACVIAPADVDAFMKYCDEENLECTIVADVTDTNRLIMTWRGETIVDISRDFLNTNGASQQQEAVVTAPTEKILFPSWFCKCRQFQRSMARSNIYIKYCFSTRPC